MSKVKLIVTSGKIEFNYGFRSQQWVRSRTPNTITITVQSRLTFFSLGKVSSKPLECIFEKHKSSASNISLENYFLKSLHIHINIKNYQNIINITIALKIWSIYKENKENFNQTLNNITTDRNKS